MAQIALDTIKTNIKTILDAANTTTGSPVDLSNGLNTRVTRVLKFHPGRIHVQASEYPYVSMFIPEIVNEQITLGNAGSQASAIRKGLVTINVVGCCYEPYFTDLTVDPGQEDVEQLMQNIEEILRSNHTLDLTSTAWISSETRHGFADEFGEEAMLRAGIFQFDFKVHY